MATDKQVNYAMSLMRKLGYSIVWMGSEHKSLGATMRERQGKVEDWLKNKSVAEMSGFIETLKEEI